MALRDKLEQIERTMGKHPAALDHEPLPDAAADAWGLWCDITAGRTQNGMGVAPLSWVDLDAWARMRGHKPTFTELELIRTIDRAFVDVQSKRGES